MANHLTAALDWHFDHIRCIRRLVVDTLISPQHYGAFILPSKVSHLFFHLVISHKSKAEGTSMMRRRKTGG